MKSMPMISLPLKGMDDVDWVGPLRHYISSVYGSSAEFNEEIVALNRLRMDARGAGKDVIGRDLLYKYYAQLDLLDLRIPVNETGCKISFTWRDAFTHIPITQHSLAFEKASLLYNLAALNSHIGADTDDLKIAYGSFRASAGVFSFILDNFLHAPSTDLMQDTVKALVKLMIAQAQEVFVERLISESTTKPSMISKLAKGASNFYKAAAEALLHVLNDKSWGERYWNQYCTIKAKHYLSICHHQQALHLEQTGKYGEALAHLTLAVNINQECLKLTVPAIYSKSTEVLTSYGETLKHKLTTLEKDNDFIYHSAIPPSAALTEIAGLEAATPTPVNELYKSEKDVNQIVGRELFSRLIPLAVHEQSSLYSEEKANLLRNEGEKVEIADEELSSALEFLDLPGSLRIVKAISQGGSGDDGYSGNSDEYTDIDANVKQWASEINSYGDSSSIGAIETKRREIYETLRNCERKLSDEETEYQKIKGRYRDRWTQVASSSLNSSLYGNVQRIKESLNSGMNSDSAIQKMLTGVSADIQILKEGPNSSQLLDLFTNAITGSNSGDKAAGQSLLDLDSSDDENLTQMIATAEDILNKLTKISKERKATFAEFKDKVHKDDISSVLVLNRRTPNIEDKLFEVELEKFHPYQTRLAATIHHQQVLLKDLSTNWKAVNNVKIVKDKTNSRQAIKARRAALVERFQKAYNAWKDSREGVQKGLEFYNDLNSFANSTLSNVDQFVRNRREEGKKLLDSLEASSGQMNQDLLRDQLSRLSVSSDQGYQGQSYQNQSQSYQTPGFPRGLSGLSSPSSGGWNPGQSSAAPTLPPKPTAPSYSPAATSPYTQPANPSNLMAPYGTPSTYDPSLYSSNSEFFQPPKPDPPQGQYSYEYRPPQPPQQDPWRRY